MSATGDPRRDEDVIREALGRVQEVFSWDDGWYDGPRPLTRQATSTTYGLDATAALDRLTARLHTLGEVVAAGEAVAEELRQHGLGNHAEGECIAGAALERWRRAVVLEGREHDKQQEHDLGGIASDARGTDALPSTNEEGA